MLVEPPTVKIAVLGLGPMGAAIASARAIAGHTVAAWNRTPRTPSEIGLPHDGSVVLHTDPRAAVDGCRVVVICVRDHDISRSLIERIAPIVGEAAIVNVSTATPAEAAESARRAVSLGLRYVTGAVMTPTSMVGTDDCVVLYAGADSDLAAIEPIVTALGGEADVVGDDHAGPPALDLAMLDVYFAGLYAFMHSAALANAHGIDVQRYLPYAEGIVDTLRGSLAAVGAAVEARSYGGGEARLDMCLAFLERIVATSNEVGIEPGLAGAVRDASIQAIEQWPGETDWDVVAERFLTSDPVDRASLARS